MDHTQVHDLPFFGNKFQTRNCLNKLILFFFVEIFLEFLNDSTVFKSDTCC